MLDVLLVSADRSLLREVGRFLTKFGYGVQTCADPTAALAVLQGNRPDFLMLDGDVAAPEFASLCRSAGGDRCRRYVYTFLLAADSRPPAVADAIAAGVDDFLARPVICGELLARLRAGARVLEYERRVREQAGLDALTGLLSRSACVAKMKSQPGASPWTCAVLTVDHLASFRQTQGDAAAHELIAAVAGWLDQLESMTHLAHFGDGQYACAVELDETAAMTWAENLRESAAAMEFSCGTHPVRVTVSIGLASGPSGSSKDADESTTLDHAAAACRFASESGHDCVVTYEQCQDERRQWNELAAAGRFFETTLARHVMTPNTLTLRPDEPLAKAIALFRQTGLQAVPVVDGLGHFQGIVPRRVLARASENGLDSLRVAEAMTSSVTRFTESTPMDKLMEHFLGTDDPLAVVLSGETPTGIVSRRNLRTLIDPLSHETFAPRSPFVSTSDYLLVPDLCPSSF